MSLLVRQSSVNQAFAALVARRDGISTGGPALAAIKLQAAWRGRRWRVWWLGRVREREEEKARARREEVEREERETERRAEHAAREERAFRRVEEMKAEEERLRRGRVEEERLRREKMMEERRRSVENWLVEDARLRDEEARQEVIRCLSAKEDESVSEERVRKERVRVEERVRRVEEMREKERVRQQERMLEERRVAEERVREEEEAEVREEAWCQSRREEAASTRIGAISRGMIARRHVSALAMEREEREKMEALTREEAATLLCAASRGMLARLAFRRSRWEEGVERLFSEAARVICFAARRWLGVVRRRERVRAASLIRDMWRRVREERREREREKDREQSREREESREEERREARREEEAARAREEEAARENAARVACEAAAEARRRQEEVERWKAEAAELLRLEQRRVEKEARALEVRRGAELARIGLERQAAAARRKEVRAQHTIRTCWKTFVIATLKAQRHLKVRVVGTCKHTEVPIVAKRRVHSISDYLLEHGVLKRQLRSEAAHFEVVQSVILPRPIVFESHSVEVQPSSVEMLLKVLMMLEAHPLFNLLVEGHADANEMQHADELSSRRAEVIKMWLLNHGARCVVETASFGAECPIAPNLTKQGMRQNRRIEFQVRMLELD
ncbi:MAG: hypothetical protein SGPRY_006997 [Prymnesium sp.]